VQVDGSSAVREAGGDVDDPGADRGGPGAAVGTGGEVSGDAGEVWAIAAQASQASFALNFPEGRCAKGPAMRSALTCSLMAWPRCWASACTRVNGESVNTA
jgi:hypothetical protein